MKIIEVFSICALLIALPITCSAQASDAFQEMKCVEQYSDRAQSFFETVFPPEQQKTPIVMTIKVENGIIKFEAYPGPESSLVGGGGSIKFDCESGEILEKEVFR